MQEELKHCIGIFIAQGYLIIVKVLYNVLKQGKTHKTVLCTKEKEKEEERPTMLLCQ